MEKTLSDTIQAALKGDEESFRAIFRSYAPKVRGTLRQMVGPQNLDDHVQDVFLRVWRGLPKLREAQGFSSWIYRITWNVAMDARKNLAREREHRATEEPHESDLTCRNSASESSIAARLVVEKALLSLTPEHRDVLVLSDLENLPQEQVAEILSIPVGTVKSRLFNGRANLRDFLKQKGVKL